MKMGKGQQYNRVNSIWIVLILLLSACNSSKEKPVEPAKPTYANIDWGKQLFHNRCSSCHKVNQDMTGPALRGVESRWPDQQKLYAFIRNSEEVIRNDKYARELWLQYNQTLMQAQPDLSNIDIRAVLDYINSVSDK